VNINKEWVLVTGGTRGIGRGLVEHLSQAGYSVVFTYNSSDELARSIEAEARASSRFVKGYRCDANSREAIAAFGDTVLRDLGAPYALINNVGITSDALLINMSTENWLDVIELNINAPFFMIKRFLSPMLERGNGCVIQMSSISALRANKGQSNYAATKAALIGFSRTMAVEVARFNLRVNVVAPGFIATEMTEKIPPEHLKAMTKQIPMRRLGTVEDVAGMVEFLLSPKATYITGQTFVVDGGISL
jgi:3-oxoacyl-[acyl-carrier protein] reductase